MEEFSSLLLARAQEANDMNVDNRDFFQVQGDFGTAASHFVDNLAEMLRLRPPDKADDGSFSVRTSFQLQHPRPLGAMRGPSTNRRNLNWLGSAVMTVLSENADLSEDEC